METCIALCDYDAQGDDEISFKKGDIITVVAKGSSSGFWEGVVGAEVSHNNKANSAPAMSSDKKKSKKENQTTTLENLKGGKRGLFPNCFVSSNMRPQLTPTFTNRAMALYDYVAKDAAEMTLHRHDVVHVVRPSASPGWWCGINETVAKSMALQREPAEVIQAKCGTLQIAAVVPIEVSSRQRLYLCI